MTTTDGAAWLALSLAGLVTAITLLSVAVAFVRLTRRPPSLITDPKAAPVSIVRPVCGLERFSLETLGSGFRLDHPTYEILFCVASSSDPAIPLIERLIAAHPRVPARLLVGDDRVSPNPKLNNCVKGWEAARHPWIVLADSNVLMPANYLARLLSSWRADTGLVCSTPLGSRPDGFWAEVECAFLNTLQARWQYAAEAFGLGFAQGKSMLWLRSFLDGRGGIRALAAEIAEDAASTKIVRAAKLRVHLVDLPFEQPLGRRRASEVWARQLRWGRLRWVTFPAFFLPEILSGPLVPAAASWAGADALGFSPLLAVAGLLAAWYGAELILAKRLGRPLGWRLPAAFAVRDLLIPALWACAFVTRDVVWRGNALRIEVNAADDIAVESART